MKNQIKFLTLASIAMLALSFTFTSCKKGDTGPAGPQGSNGTNGTNGKDGNANVKNSNIFVNANEWVYTVGQCKVTKLVPEITADIVNKGMVMVYWEGATAGSWDALPATYAGTNGTVETYGYTIEPGKLHLLVTFNANVTLPAGTILSSNFKVVLISGSDRVAHPYMDLSNYNEVISTLGISAEVTKASE
jgi:hypothetical protein